MTWLEEVGADFIANQQDRARRTYMREAPMRDVRARHHRERHAIRHTVVKWEEETLQCLGVVAWRYGSNERKLE